MALLALPACNAHLFVSHTPTLFFPALQAYIPVSARAVRLPRELHARVSLCLPLGAARPAAGLAVVLLHPFPGDPRWRYRYHLGAEQRRRWDAAQTVAAEAQRVQPPECGQLALLASLASAPHRLGSSSVAAGDVGATAGSVEGSDSEGRLLEPCITATAAFTLLPSGSQVGYSIVPLDGLLAGSSKAEVSKAGGTWLGTSWRAALAWEALALRLQCAAPGAARHVLHHAALPGCTDRPPHSRTSCAPCRA